MKLPVVLVLLAVSLAGSLVFWYFSIFQGQTPEVAAPEPAPRDTLAVLCKEFQNVDSKVSCELAVAIASDEAPGTVRHVSIGPVRASVASSSGSIERRTVDMWLIDIALAEPYFDKAFGKQINLLQVGIRLNVPNVAYRKPLG